MPVLFMGGLLAVALGAQGAASAGYLDPSQLGGRMLVGISASIFMGCLAAHLTHSPRGFAWVSRVLGQAWSVPLMAVLLAGAVAWHGTPNGLVSLVMTALVVATCIRPKQPLAPVLGHAWVRYVGTVSYGVYLLHMLTLNVVRRALPGQGVAVQLVLTLAVSVGVATLSHRYFESWFLELKSRFDWRERPRHEVPAVRRPRAPAQEPGVLVGVGVKA